MVMPTQWLQRFLATGHESLEDVNAEAQSVMGAYNDVAEALLNRRERFGDSTLAFARKDTDGSALINWHRGFLDAMDLSPDEWRSLLSSFERKDIVAPLALISQCSQDPSKRGWLADDELRENVGRMLGIMVARLWEAYRGEPMVELEFDDASSRRANPAPGRNASS